MMRPGDWNCGCGELNFKSRSQCRKCGTAKINQQPNKENQQHTGDWNCNCGEMNFARRNQCRKCGKEKPNQQQIIEKPGDWNCNCGELNFKSRSQCRKCGSSKPELTQSENNQQEQHRINEDQVFDIQTQSENNQQDQHGKNEDQVFDIRFNITQESNPVKACIRCKMTLSLDVNGPCRYHSGSIYYFHDSSGYGDHGHIWNCCQRETYDSSGQSVQCHQDGCNVADCHSSS